MIDLKAYQPGTLCTIKRIPGDSHSVGRRLHVARSSFCAAAWWRFLPFDYVG